MVDADAGKIPNSGLWKQIIASLIVSFASLLGGLYQGWGSPMSLFLRSDDSPVGKLSKSEIATLLSVPSYVAIPAAFLTVPMADFLGRKFSIILTAVCSAVGSLVVVFAKTVWLLYVGKLIGVIGSLGFLVAPMYISECVHYSVRGRLLSINTVQVNLGILLAYITGKFFNYTWFNATAVIIAFASGLLTVLLPETPYYFVGKSQDKQAEKSLRWLRGNSQNVVMLELEAIHELSEQNGQAANMSIMDIFKSKSARFGLFVGLMGYTFQMLSGIAVVVQLAGMIFHEAGSPLSSDDSAIITALLNLSSALINMMIIDKVGRKPLLYTSFIGGTVTLSLFAAYLIAKQQGTSVEQLSWVPIVTIGAFIFTYGLGLASIPNILTNELLPSEARAMSFAVISIVAHLLFAAAVQVFPYLDDGLGLYSPFLIAAACNGLGIIFTWFFVPETKGKSFNEITEEVNG